MKVDIAVALLIDLLQGATALGNAIRAAQAEGRSDLTDDEVAQFRKQDDEARANLQAKIDAI